MAKSFKQLTGAQPVKRTSEKDILDFLEQDHVSTPAPAPASNPAPKTSRVQPAPDRPLPALDPADAPEPVSRAAEAPAASATEAESVPARKRPAKRDATVLTDGANEPDDKGITGITNNTESETDVRQTFVLGQQYLEKLKNFVHTRRTQGQYDFTQKQALHQALDLLFATGRIEERPEQIRQKEEARRQQIRKGRAK